MNANSLPLWSSPALILNVFELRGPDFLQFFVCFAIVVFVAAFTWRRFLISAYPVQRGWSGPSDLNAHELAFLAGRGTLAVNAALVGLSESGKVSVSDKGNVRLLRPLSEFEGALPLERAIARACSSGGALLKHIRPQTRAWIENTRADLEERGLIYAATTAARAVRWPLLLALVVPACAVVKIVIGLQRDKPVGFLIFGLVFTLIAGLILFARRPFRTPAADRLLESLRREKMELSSNPTLERAALPLAVALFGLTVLRATPYAPLEKTLVPRDAGGTTGGTCGSGGCGGGGGGCGGGCGGCGGG